MTNKEIFALIAEESILFDKLYSVALQHESSDLKSFLAYDFSEEAYQKYLPEQYKNFIESIIDEGDQDMLLEAFMEEDVFGFFCEVLIPKRTNFSFNEDGSFASCSLSMGYTTVEYVYAETMEELAKEAVRLSEEWCAKWEEEARKKLAE